MRARQRRGERGVFVPMVALGAVVLFGFAGLAIDTGRAYLLQRDLQAASDAASLGGAVTLSTASWTHVVGVGGRYGACEVPAATEAIAAAAINRIAVWDANRACSDSSGAHCVKAAGAAGFDVVYYDTRSPRAGPGCTGGTWTTRVEVIIPASAAAPNPPLPPHCLTAPYNCVEVVVNQVMPTAVMRIFGLRSTTITEASTSYGQGF